VSAHFPRCDDCGQLLSCETDWIGRMYYVHPGRCVPRPVQHIRECAICEKEIVFKEQPPFRKKLFACSPTCEAALKERRRLMVLEYWRAHKQKKQRAA